jgi:alpha-ketoglutarate-dependent taurine dioxygenase
MSVTSLHVVPLSGALGAECVGVDLTKLTEETWTEILDAYHTYSLLVIRGQSLGKADQVQFSRRFGELELPVRDAYIGKDFAALHVVSNVGPDGKPKSTKQLDNPGNYFWHTDGSFMRVPASATLLYGVEVPDAGGDTLFANMQAAYDALSPAMKARIQNLRVIHSFEQSRLNSGSRLASDEEKRRAPPVAHPLVRVHPDTGKKGLYLGIHTSHIEGMDIEEGRALLRELVDHATQAQFVYRHKWRRGDFVVWDNRNLLHKATDDFDMANCPRTLHRTVIQGTVPQ